MINRTLTAHTKIVVHKPKVLLKQLCEHLCEYDGIDYTADGCNYRLNSPYGIAEMCERDQGFDVRIEAGSLPAILDMRSIIAHHVVEFATEAVRIRWTGDGAQIRKPLNYRVLTVASIEDLTPRMRRIHFSLDNPVAFASQTHIHIRLVFAREETILGGPEIGEDGLERWPGNEPRPDSRVYTIRRINAATCTLTVDFVLHPESGGPGCRFAQQARLGQRIGMTGPGGASLPLDRDWYLIAGDETALPAISRFMEMLPESASGHVVIEVATDEDSVRQKLRLPTGISIDWVPRIRGLMSVARHYRPPAEAHSPFVWVGCEEQNFRLLREHVRNNMGLEKGSHLIVAYWNANGS